MIVKKKVRRRHMTKIIIVLKELKVDMKNFFYYMVFA